VAKARKNNNPKLVFEKAKETPKPKPNKAPSGKTNSVKKVLPTKDGIYKLAKKPATPATASSNKKKSKYKGNNKVQFSSRGKAEKAMRKTVKRRQKGKGVKSMFDL
jgi:hypothetical protein